jgi:outer membrane protein assembly factor BamD
MPNTDLIISRTALLACLAATTVFAACGGGASRYQDMEPDVLFQLATDEFAEGDHGNAIEVLDRILIAHGDWDRIPEARLMLGDVYFDRGDFLTARSEYTRFIDRYAGHPRSADASLGICKSLASLAPAAERDQGYTQEAITSCRNVVIDFAGREQSADAARISNELRHTLAEKEFLTGEFYYRRGLWDAAIKYYEFVANLYPESDYAPGALLGVYLSNEQIGYQDLADEARDLLLQRYPDSEAAEQVKALGPEAVDGNRG